MTKIARVGAGNRYFHVGSASAHQVSHSRKLSPVELVDCSAERGWRKLRPKARQPYCASTYVSIRQTCPDSCSLKDNGCYAQTGFTSVAQRRMDAAGTRRDPDQPMIDEAAAIDAIYRRGVPQQGGRDGKSGLDLRLHVAGDVTSETGAAILARAAERWQARGGGTVWTYTHRWREVRRRAWGPISVLASVESADDARRAMWKGYAVAWTFPEQVSDKTFDMGFVKVAPCPYEAGGTTCVQCRLCLDRDLKQLNLGVAFAFHGPKGGRSMRQLKLPVVR